MNTTTIVTLSEEAAIYLILCGQEIAFGHGQVGSAERRYASLMTSAFPGWHMLAADDNSNEGKLLRSGPKAKLFEQLKSAKHTNPATVWARVRKYAAEELASNEGGEGEGGEGEKTKAREIRTRLREEIAKLVKAIDREEFPAEDLRAVKDLLELAILKIA